MDNKTKMAYEIAAMAEKAEKCGITTEDAFNDITSSFETPDKIMAGDVPPSDNILGGLGERWIIWWEIFLQEYSSKCTKRWGTVYGRSLGAETLKEF